MTARNALKLFTALGLFLATAGAVFAADREKWVFADGFFVKLKGAKWAERNNGEPEKNAFKFVEVARTPEYVEIYDKSRDTSIRLRKTHSTIKQGADGKFNKLYDGMWAE